MPEFSQVETRPQRATSFKVRRRSSGVSPSAKRGRFQFGRNSATEVLIGLGLTIFLLYAGREFFVPLTLAVLLSFMAGRGLRILESRGVPSRVSGLLLALAVLTVVVAGVWLISAQLSSVASQLPAYRATLRTKLVLIESKVHAALDQVRLLPRRGSADRQGSDPQAADLQAPLVRAVGSSLGEVQDFAPGVLHFLALSVFVIVLAMFLAVCRDDVRDRIVRLAGQRNVHIASELLDEVALKVSAFLWAQLLVNSCFGLVTGILFAALGLHYAALWGTLLALLRFVPFVGVIIGGTLPIFFALATAPSWTLALAVFISLTSVDFLLNQYIEPKFIGSRIGLSPAAVLISAFGWTCLWGPVGLLLATPLTTCLVVAGRFIPRLAFTSILFSDEEALPPRLQLYHRALSKGDLSSDPWLATHIEAVGAESFLSESFLPALGLLCRQRNRGDLPQARFRHACAALRAILPLVESKLPPLPERGEDGNPVFLVVPVSESVEVIAASALRFLGASLGGTWYAVERGNARQRIREALQRWPVKAIVYCRADGIPRGPQEISRLSDTNAVSSYVYYITEPEGLVSPSRRAANGLYSARDFKAKMLELQTTDQGLTQV
ncbi:MAG: AI-2E family transporter [Deltaproteobacteria bacterium]|nr:AI-2E family transporter [Deltaproteobacteria bacterium]